MAFPMHSGDAMTIEAFRTQISEVITSLNDKLCIRLQALEEKVEGRCRLLDAQVDALGTVLSRVEAIANNTAMHLRKQADAECEMKELQACDTELERSTASQANKEPCKVFLVPVPIDRLLDRIERLESTVSGSFTVGGKALTELSAQATRYDAEVNRACKMNEKLLDGRADSDKSNLISERTNKLERNVCEGTAAFGEWIVNHDCNVLGKQCDCVQGHDETQTHALEPPVEKAVSRLAALPEGIHRPNEERQGRTRVLEALDGPFNGEEVKHAESRVKDQTVLESLSEHVYNLAGKINTSCIDITQLDSEEACYSITSKLLIRSTDSNGRLSPATPAESTVPARATHISRMLTGGLNMGSSSFSACADWAVGGTRALSALPGASGSGTIESVKVASARTPVTSPCIEKRASPAKTATIPLPSAPWLHGMEKPAPPSKSPVKPPPLARDCFASPLALTPAPQQESWKHVTARLEIIGLCASSPEHPRLHAVPSAAVGGPLVAALLLPPDE